MGLTVRDLVYIGVFGSLWGAAEISLGSALHMLRAPFAGAIMAGAGMAIALIGRLFVQKRGSILFIGMVTATLKLFSIGGIILSPLLGILLEGLLAESAVSVLGTNRTSFVLAGSLAATWTLLHPFLTMGLVAGHGLLTVYGWTLEKGARALGLDATAGLIAVSALIAVHVLWGATAGWVAWEAGRNVQERLRLTEA